MRLAASHTNSYYVRETVEGCQRKLSRMLRCVCDFGKEKAVRTNASRHILLVLAVILFIFSCGDDNKDNPVHPNSPPAEPINDTANGSPADGATGISRDPILRWIGSDPDDDVLSYDVYFGTQADPEIAAGNLGDPLFAPLTELGAGVIYYWRVEAEDEHGEETSSPVWHFTTQ